MLSLQVFFVGNVQGVGFRWTVKRIATGFEVIGWVRTGEESEVRAFIEAIGQSELRSHIREQTEFVLPEPPRARGFEIRHD